MSDKIEEKTWRQNTVHELETVKPSDLDEMEIKLEAPSEVFLMHSILSASSILIGESIPLKRWIKYLEDEINKRGML
jgi:hypothetical protein